MHVRLLCARIKGSLITQPPLFRWCLTSVILIGIVGIWLLWWYMPSLAHLQQLRVTAQQYSSWSSMLEQQQKTLHIMQTTTQHSYNTRVTKPCSKQRLLELVVSRAQDCHLGLRECNIDHHDKTTHGLCTWELEGSINQISDYIQHMLTSSEVLTMEHLTLTWLTEERIQMRGRTSSASY